MSNGAWHPDPTGRWEVRWFDRSGWTDHVRRGEHVGVDPLPRNQQPANWQPHYFAEVNRKGLNVNRLSKVLNQRWEGGYRLAHIFEQEGNTVMVFELRNGRES